MVTTEKEKINKDDEMLEASERDDQKFQKLGEVPGEKCKAFDYFAKFSFFKTLLWRSDEK